MAKSHNQKAKILFLVKMLLDTGEDRVVTMQDILARLGEFGISAERKSIYDDLEALRDFGLDVKFKRGRPGGYYLADSEPLAGWKERIDRKKPDGEAAVETVSEGEGMESKTADERPSDSPGNPREADENFGKNSRSEAGEKEEPSGERTLLEPEREEPSGERASLEPEKEEPSGERASLEPEREEPSGERASLEPEREEPSGKRTFRVTENRERSGEEKKMRLLCSLRREKEIREYFGDEGEYKDKGYGNFTLVVPLRNTPAFYGWLASMERDVYIVKPRKAAAAYKEYLKRIVREYKGIG